MTNELYWYEQSSVDVPPGDEWLSSGEISHLRRLRIPKRAADWRLGRWTAKRALADRMQAELGATDLAVIEVLAAATGAPDYSIANIPRQWNISITHSQSRAACALARAGIAVGGDLERIEERDPAFLADYFTPEEQQTFADAPATDRALLATLYWSAKESALKLLQEGLRLDTRSVSVTRAGTPLPCSLWSRLEVRVEGRRVLHGWWRGGRHFVRTVICDPPATAPQSLILPPVNWSCASRGSHALAFAHPTAD